MKHLSYRQFKNIFGDLGVTAWTKFNWLSNGLPDGTYNGITKVTITSISTLNVTASAKRAKLDITPIGSDSAGEKWSYGFSNYEIFSANDSWLRSDIVGISVNSKTGDQNMFVNIKDLSTVDEYNAYLKKHPLVIYYYDRNDWEGVSYNFSSAFNGGVRLFQSGRFFVNFHLCDWRYVSLGYYKSPLDFPKPKAFTFFYYGAKESSAANLCVYPYDHAITDLSEVEQERLKEPVYFVFKK